MPKLENALITLNELSRPGERTVSAGSQLVVATVYLIAVLSVPLYAPQKLVWLAIYPVIQSEISGVGYGRVFMKSLWVLPLILLIGIFNPFIDRETAFTVGGVSVSRGWVSYISLTLRGLLALQALILLTMGAGVYGISRVLRRIGCPRVLVTQIEFTYRYMMVVIDEALGMDRARKARGYGHNSYPLKMWARMAGQLLIRSYERALRIHRAMLSRGFDGTVPETYDASASGSKTRSWIFAIIWIAVIALLRFVDFSFFFD